MGLASKLQQAQAAAGALGPMMGGMPMGAGQHGAPSAPPYPPAGGAPYGAPGAAPYPQQGASPYPAPYPAAPGAPQPAGTSPYPSPYPPGALPPSAMPPQQQQQQQPMGMPGGAPSPYPPQASPQGGAPPTGYPGGYPGSQMPPQQQQQQYGAPPVAAIGGGSSGMLGSIQAKLNQIVTANQLQRFYPPQALSALASRLDARVNFRDLAARWTMPVELALDLAALALYDIVIVADDSGSMAFEENGERIEDLKMIAQKVSEVATLFDDDGILVRFMNSDVQGNSVRSPADVQTLLSQVQYSGLTPLAASMQSKVLQPIVFSLASSGQLAKPVLIITITDGEPTDTPKDMVVQVIKDARNRLAAQYGPKAVAFEFAQVGKDQRAQAFLGQLDSHPEVGSSIDCTSYYELECVEYQRRGINLSPSMWLVKMMVGAIDLSHDKGDEQR